MHIGICRMMLRVPDAQSLKEKRQAARSLTTRIRNRFNVAVAETDDNDLWQRLTIGVCCVSNDASHANEILSRVVSFVQETRSDLELLEYHTETISAG